MSDTNAFGGIERKWQEHWERNCTFRAANPGEPGSERPKYYVLDFFPYPSGAGLHVGHPLGYIATDIIARYMRMRGFNVLHPMGWDAFGLPAEQYAIDHGVHPAVTTRRNIETYRRQLRAIGFSYDWSRELATCDESYYRWTQWIFLQIYDSWYDPEHRWRDSAGREVVGKARPIAELAIPPDVQAEGPAAVEAFQADHRLAYRAEVAVNWCPALGTVLSNEEVTNDGRSERGDHPVYRRPMRQWMLRITEYADRLLHDLDMLDWPEAIKLQQRNWIGRSEGAYVDFHLADGEGASNNVIRVFTTRPDTLFGATYMVLAPEHRLVDLVTTAAQRPAVAAYVAAARQKTELDRTADARSKTGVFTGAYAINPANRQRVPIWVADYVLMGYGTGSIMAVPAHDQRDYDFAKEFGLPIRTVIAPPAGLASPDDAAFVDDGVNVDSPPDDPAHRFAGQCSLNGLPTPEAKRAMTRWLEESGLGEGTVQYKLRDWLFSRQRYWGEPFPIVYGPDGRTAAIEETDLPVSLPPMDDFKPEASDDPHAEPQTPLSRARDWVSVKRGDETFRRELNTMPQWAGSCWYYLRFCDPANDRTAIAAEVEKYWMGGGGAPRAGGVDLYLGGAEHAVLHLLYARFWHKVLYDLGHVSTPEPFQRLFNQGMVGADAFRDERGAYVPAAEVVEAAETEMLHPTELDKAQYESLTRGGYGEIEARARARQKVKTRYYYKGRPVFKLYEKMSKTKKNVVNPDDMVREFGADTLRLYEMYMGPLEASKPWNTRDIAGPHRFLQRVWRLVCGDESEPSAAAPRALNPRLAESGDEELDRLLHKTIRKVQQDMERLGFNTAIAQMMVFVNEAQKAQRVGRSQVERFVLLLAPFAPHLCEELWERLGHGGSLAYAPWPAYDEALTRDETIEYAVQVNGKVRGRFSIAADAADDQITAAAEDVENVRREVGGRAIRKKLVVRGRLVNLIV